MDKTTNQSLASLVEKLITKKNIVTNYKIWNCYYGNYPRTTSVRETINWFYFITNIISCHFCYWNTNIAFWIFEIIEDVKDWTEIGSTKMLTYFRNSIVPNNNAQCKLDNWKCDNKNFSSFELKFNRRQQLIIVFEKVFISVWKWHFPQN